MIVRIEVSSINISKLFSPNISKYIFSYTIISIKYSHQNYLYDLLTNKTIMIF